MSDFVRATFEVARKEVMQHIRTKRLLIIGLIMLFLLVMITLVFGPNVTKDASNVPSTTGNADHPYTNALENTVLTVYFGVSIVGGLQFTQLLAIILTGDAVCSEWSNRTIFLLLSKPVSRTAFVAGKMLGNLFTVFATIAVLFILDYILMQPFYAGSPDGAEVAGFFLMLLFILLGCAAFASISLFFSTITKSTLMSFLFTLATWLIGFPILGNIGVFMSIRDAASNGNVQNFYDLPKVQAWLYLNPVADMQAGLRALLPHDDGSAATLLRYLNFFNGAPNDAVLAAFVLVGYTVGFFALSLVVVNRRNFE